MDTKKRAYYLAKAITHFPLLGEITAENLLALIELELSHKEILDHFCPYGEIRTKAIPPQTILHILSGNTPHAGLQSLIRGLLLGSHNYCKLPSSGLPEMEHFTKKLPQELQNKVELNKTLPEEWMQSADVLIVFGNEETVHNFRQRCQPHQRFLAHGHKVSLGIVFADPHQESPLLAARDISLFDQQGCLSLHDIYIYQEKKDTAKEYAAKLATAMETFNRETPRRELSAEETSRILHLRSSYAFRAANDSRVALWQSEHSTDWTLIYEEDPDFAFSCLNRLAFIKPLPDNLEMYLQPILPYLSTIAIHPFREPFLSKAAKLGATRICALGNAQRPSFFWHQDGEQTLANLVHWIDA